MVVVGASRPPDLDEADRAPQRVRARDEHAVVVGAGTGTQYGACPVVKLSTRRYRGLIAGARAITHKKGSVVAPNGTRTCDQGGVPITIHTHLAAAGIHNLAAIADNHGVGVGPAIETEVNGAAG